MSMRGSIDSRVSPADWDHFARSMKDSMLEAPYLSHSEALP